MDYDRMSEIFDLTRSRSPELLSAVATGVSAVAGPGEKVLDVGCGTGRFMVPLADAGIEVFGVDISSGMLGKARAKGIGGLVRGDAAALPFAPRAFKAALVTNLLHLVKDWKKVVAEACRVSERAVLSFDIGRDENDPIAAFKRLMEEAGVPQPRAGPLESELAEECGPEFRVDLGRYVERKGRKEVLAAFEQRTYTFQADLSEGENRGLIEEFARRFDGETLEYSNSITMIVWDPSRLSREVCRTTFGYPQSRTF